MHKKPFVNVLGFSKHFTFKIKQHSLEKTTDGFAKNGWLIRDANLCKVRPEGCYNEREEVTESPREVAGVRDNLFASVREIAPAGVHHI